ncbi:N-acetylneuraminate lyase-like [Gigantopelta aegis]|uniref:N-acetylneuraminate lyase-like n=1 Tax=Gigantopelta aegis TaxID=1735272 RepID=UPI001B889D0A|nr:N-acetylneuraminate lyase-like [Gigantopelta aegis]
MDEFRIRGLVAATFTAFDARGEIVLDIIPKYVQFLTDSGVKNVFVNGTTGEGPSLTLDERKRLAEKWVKVGKDKLSRVIIHIGCANLKDTQTLMKHATEIGADAVATVPPFFFRTTSIDSLVEYVRRIGEVSPDMPLYYYHIPPVMSMSEFLTRARTSIPSLKGIKFSSTDLYEAGLCVETCDAQDRKYNMLFGCDEQLIAGLAVGFDGAVGSTYNFLGPLYLRMLDAWSSGDTMAASREQSRSRQVINTLFKYAQATGNLVSVMKCVMNLTGLDCGSPRCPITAVDTEQKQQLKEELETIGFFQWNKK